MKRLAALTALVAGAIAGVPAAQEPSERVDFTRDIQPLLQRSCISCHGPAKSKGQLRLDSKAAAMKGGVSGKVILPGDGRSSRLYRLLVEPNEEDRMPQKASPFSKKDVELLRAWIDQGAVWPEGAARGAKAEAHWAYVKPVRPAIPQVMNDRRVRNSIDAFVLARLEREGLAPSNEAPREKLLRRVSLDLIGLPPSPEEMDAFEADRSPEPYERVVDRLLASPHFGERWARPWLDLARYADSNGYEKDAPRVMWKWRDWVIDAFNRDLPFSQFTIEQIAGDLLPNATVDQKIATGFHRNSTLNEEDGVDREEMRWNTLVERTSTLACVWLGTTLACAQCHHHKFDPFSQADFYRMLAFFENADEPTLELPTPEQQARRLALQTELASLEKDFRRPDPKVEVDEARWEGDLRGLLGGWTLLRPDEIRSAGGATFARRDDGSILAGGPCAERDVYTVTARTTLRGIRAFRLDVLPDDSLPRGGPGRGPSGDFVLTEFKVFTEGRPVVLQKPVADFASKYAWISQAIDGNPETGWAIGPKVGRPHTAFFETRQPVGSDGETVLTFVLEHQSRHPRHLLGRFRLWALATADPSPVLRLPERIRALLERPPSEWSESQREELREHYRSIAPSLEPLRARIAALRKQIDAIGIPTAWVLGERPGSGRPSTFVRHRGNFLVKRDEVPADVPATLPPLLSREHPNRLGLARWLVSEENPLTARVAVNRLWEQLFGRGLVETSEDFGTQGTRPSHPELLDWLATEFMRKGWSVKKILRTIVTSATYRQSSIVTRELRERDPDNRLLARGASFRMEAEMIRDVALAASGLLSRKIGGPSVYPHQPEGIWNIAISKDRETWTTSPGAEAYRRGIYTFWRRSAPYPSFVTFDAPSREICTVRRSRTNTPLQALTLLNDPAFFEAARALARRMANEGGCKPRAQIRYGFRCCTGRIPDGEELGVLLMLNEREGTRGTGDEGQALTLVANAILNLDETIVKD